MGRPWRSSTGLAAPDAMPWVDRKSWPNRVTLGYDFHDPKWEWYVGTKTSRSFTSRTRKLDEGGSRNHDGHHRRAHG